VAKPPVKKVPAKKPVDPNANELFPENPYEPKSDNFRNMLFS